MINGGVDMSKNKKIEILIHASAFFLPILLSLGFLLFTNDKRIRKIANQAFIFHLIFVSLFLVSNLLKLIFIGYLIQVVVVICFLLLPAMGIIALYNDEDDWEYPILDRFIK